MMASPSTRSPMAKMTASTSVPKSMQATYEAITALIDAFCREHLNEDYRELARRMTAALCRKRPSPLASGQPRTWACGIVYVLGQINFLTDPSTQMLWGGGDGMARSPPEATDGAPHATAERLEPVTCCSEPGRHLDRRHRDEPIELARRRHRPRDCASPAEEARG